MLPQKEVPLETTESTAYFQKMEVHKGIYWYTTDLHSTANLISLPVQRVREIQAMTERESNRNDLLNPDSPGKLLLPQWTFLRTTHLPGLILPYRQTSTPAFPQKEKQEI